MGLVNFALKLVPIDIRNAINEKLVKDVSITHYVFCIGYVLRSTDHFVADCKFYCLHNGEH